MRAIVKFGLFIAILLTLSQGVFAQKSIIKGQVTDEQKEAIPGVTVSVVGKAISTKTGEKGEFSILADSTDKLKFSFIGKENRTVDIRSRLYVNMVLKSVVAGLDEVIVIGYETVRRSEVTGSISSIKGSDLTKELTPNVVSGLVGKASGVYVRNTGNEPGGATSIKIRGLSSINGTGEPLYVIDGIYADDISFLNPADIGSIEILKDAASTAIYGSRGANGVVLITTNKPRSGQTTTTYSSFFTVKNSARYIDLVGAKDYAKLFYEMSSNRPDIITPSTEILGFLQKDSATWGEGYNMAKEAQQPWTLQNHSLKINFGKGESTTGFGINYVKDNGIFRNQDYNRLNLSLSNTSKLSKAVEFGYTGNITRQIYNHLQDGQAALETIYGITPVTPIYNKDGSYNLSNMFGEPKTYENPLARLANSTDIDKRSLILSNAFLNFSITPELKFKASLKFNSNSRERLSYLPTTTLEGSLTSGLAEVITNKSEEYTNNYLVTYSLPKSKHSFTFLGGLELSERLMSSTGTSVTQFNSDIYGPYNLGAGALINSYGSSKSKESLVGFLGRVNYKYDDKYFVTITSRYDGSSKFGANNRWSYFPGIALAWDMNKENFLANSKIISSWKWRLSSGQSGSSNILPYQSQGSIYSLGLAVSTPMYGFGNTSVAAEAPQTFSNPNLKWEVTSDYNLGTDIALWKNRVNFSGEVYIRKISDLLVKGFPLPGVSGFSSSTRNGGDMTNTGFEFKLNGDVMTTKDFKLKANIVFSQYKNEITKWLGGGGQFINENKYTGYVAEGKAYGVFWEVPQLGIFADQNEVNNYAIKNPTTGNTTLIQPTAKPGDIKYKDVNGDGIINVYDRTVVGSPHPKFTLGFGFDATYKNWSLNIFINSVYGKDVYNASNDLLMNTNLFNTNKFNDPWGSATTVSTRMLNRWTPNNIHTNVPKLGSISSNGMSPNITNVEDGSFVRVQNIALTYKLPANKIAFIKSASIVGSVQNAFLFTKYKGTDPENVQPEPGGWATNQSSSILAYDNFGYPRPIVYTIGINVGF